MNKFMSSYDRSPQGLKMICFWAKYRICAIWTAIALNRKFLSFRKVENFVNYKVSSYMGDAAKKSSTDIRGRKFHWVLWITPLTGGANISCFLLLRFLVQIMISEYKWQNMYPLFPSLVFLWPGLDESELVAFSINPLILTNRAARGF